MTDERAVIAVPDERGVLRATRLDELTWRPSAYAIVLRLAASRLWDSTRSAGLFLGDRCCPALAARPGLPAVTADGSWSALDLGVDVVSIRGGT